jgi:hypothetical protein
VGRFEGSLKLDGRRGEGRNGGGHDERAQNQRKKFFHFFSLLRKI